MESEKKHTQKTQPDIKTILTYQIMQGENYNTSVRIGLVQDYGEILVAQTEVMLKEQHKRICANLANRLPKKGSSDGHESKHTGILNSAPPVSSPDTTQRKVLTINNKPDQHESTSTKDEEDIWNQLIPFIENDKEEAVISTSPETSSASKSSKGAEIANPAYKSNVKPILNPKTLDRLAQSFTPNTTSRESIKRPPDSDARKGQGELPNGLVRNEPEAEAQAASALSPEALTQKPQDEQKTAQHSNQ